MAVNEKVRNYFLQSIVELQDGFTYLKNDALTLKNLQP